MSANKSEKVAPQGHNQPVAAKQLTSICERVEKLNEDKAEILSDIKEVFLEAKGNGFDVKTIRKIIRERAMEAAEREEAEALMDTYRRAVGLIPDLDV